MIAIAVGVSALIIVIGAILWYGHHVKVSIKHVLFDVLQLYFFLHYTTVI